MWRRKTPALVDLPIQQEEKDGVIALVTVFVVLAIPVWWHLVSVPHTPLPLDTLDALRVDVDTRGVLCVHSSSAKVARSLAVHMQSAFQVRTQPCSTHHELRLEVRDSEATNADASIRVFANGTAVMRVSMHGDTHAWSQGHTHAVLSAFVEHVVRGKRGPERHTLPLSPRYSVSLTMMHADASNRTALFAHSWTPWLERYVRPLVAQVEAALCVQVEVEAQSKAMSGWRSAKAAQVTRSGDHVYEHTQVREFVQLHDWDVQSSDTRGPTLNYVVYVPASVQQPLYVRHNGRMRTSVLLPRWGGVYILNREAEQQHALHGAMRAWVSHLRAAMGLPTTWHTSPAPGLHLDTPKRGIAAWELQQLRRWRSEAMAKHSRSTLRALADVVRSIPNMAIEAHIATRVQRAIAEVQATTDGSRDVCHGVAALSLANDAYYDPSVLAQLYVPDEHKMGVYLPLFGPIALPLLVMWLRRWKQASATVHGDA